MKQLLTTGIILSRTDYGEADRIITLLTPDYGKLRLMAKGVRKIKSKLAGGIELFSVSNITFLQGRNEVGTLISTRLLKHYGNIVNDIERVQLGYDLIKLLNKVTEDEPESEYFEMLDSAFAALDNPGISLQLIRGWFQAQLLAQAGHKPNLQTDGAGNPLDPTKRYGFDFEAMALTLQPSGLLRAGHIKFLRLLFSNNPPQAIAKVEGGEKLLDSLVGLVRTMAQTHLRL